jgi:L-histidine N-alpha-methyltransferase
LREKGDAPVTVSVLTEPGDRRAQMMEEVRIGLTTFHKHLPSKYFYDGRGSELFEEITRLPEYYLTRSELEIIAANADALMGLVRPHELVELGSGSSTKTTLLLEAMRRHGGSRYVPIDISADALRSAAKELCSTYLWLEIDALIGDYLMDFARLRRRGRRLICFLGSTVGNYTPTLRRSLFSSIASSMTEGDHFLLGVDLVKDEQTMIRAYDDPAGVSAEFNRNILHVVNRELDGDIPVEAFEHVSRFHRASSCMVQSLRATRNLVANIRAIDLAVSFEEGEEIHTEVSCKFNRSQIESEFKSVGMRLESWMTDDNDHFAMALGTSSD